MITKIDSSNQKKYEALFANAMKDLKEVKGEEVEINSLETYFSKIEELLNELDESKGAEYGRKYTILPLDEEHFEIDTNARTIKVPEAFRKNGIAVQGDMAAETLYFKVPRYFDAMDLNNTSIYIQWQYTNSQNNNVEKGISHEWVRDIESEDDYLIFGWTLGGRITEEAGNLQFSVRFVLGKKDERTGITNISYSLSTLTTNVIINPGLNYSLDEPGMLETLDDIINSNYINTTTKTDSEIDVFKYVWDLDKLYTGSATSIPTTIERDLDSDGNLLVELSAYVTPGEVFNYSLYKQLSEVADITKDKKIPMTIEYKSTTDTVYHENGPKIYYKQNTDGTTYSRLYPDITQPLPEGTYEKYGKVTLNKDMTNVAGTYYGVARAQINSTESGPQYTKFKVSIMEPTPLILDNDNIVYKNHIIKGDSHPALSINFAQASEKDILEYKWYRNNSDEVVSTDAVFVPMETGKYHAEISSIRNFTSSPTVKTSDFIVTLPAAAPTIENDVDDGNVIKTPIVFSVIDNNDTSIAESKIVYSLYLIGYDASGNYTRDLKATSDTPSFTVNTAGLYQCGAQSFYNGTESEIIFTDFVHRQ